MNKAHLEICASPEWARLVEDELLPWVLDGHELGEDLLEVGPAPGGPPTSCGISAGFAVADVALATTATRDRGSKPVPWDG